MATKKKLILINENLLEKLVTIQDRNAIDTLSETIKHCIRYTYSKENPAYSSPKLTPEEKEKKEKKQASKICRSLKGNLTVDNLGDAVCEYHTYTEVAGGGVEKMRMVKPLEFLTDDLVSKQYTDIVGKSMSDEKKKKYKLID